MPKTATIFILGPDADKIHFIGDLMGLRIENLIHQKILVLRRFRERLDRLGNG